MADTRGAVRRERWLAAGGLALGLNSVYLAARSDPTLLYFGNVVLHLVLGVAVTAALVPLLRRHFSALGPLLKAAALCLLAAAALGLFLMIFGATRPYRWALYVAFVCGILSVMLTYSRGGLLGLAAVLFAITLKSKNKIVAASLVTLCFLAVITFAPPQWMSRMGGFLQGNVDGSGQQRLISWGTAWNFAMDYPITGGSFNALPNTELFQRYQRDALPGGFLSTGPHSIYFQTLEEQGFVGLGLYLLLVASCWASLFSLRRKASRSSSSRWIIAYTHMIEVSLFGFLVSGAFLGLANFDLFYQLVAMVIILKVLYGDEVAATAPVRVVESEPGALTEDELVAERG